MIFSVFGLSTNASAVSVSGVSYPFSVTTTSLAANGTFPFSLSAQGTFYVDCGDGGTLSGTGVSGGTIDRSSTTDNDMYTCTYSTAGVKTIRFGGLATAYNEDWYTPIAFSDLDGRFDCDYLNSVSGDISGIFPVLGDDVDKCPAFYYLFTNCPMTGIPDHMFSGYTSVCDYMFYGAFINARFEGYIPPTLFAGLIANGSPDAEDLMTDIFDGVEYMGNMVTSCPDGTVPYTTGYEKYWNGYVSCFVSTTVNVTYSCGVGGGNAPSSVTVTSGTQFTTASNTCNTPNGYVFNGWLVSGTSSIIPSGSSFNWVYDEDKTLTAQYLPLHTVTYACGSGTGNAPTDSNNPYMSGTTATTLSNTCTPPSGYTFDKWSCGGTNVNVGSTFTVSSNTTCTAQYVPVYTVTYACGSGTGNAPTDSNGPYLAGTTVTTLLNTCTPPNGKMFDKWNCGGTNIKMGGVITVSANVTCTAQYRDSGLAVTTSATNSFKFLLSAQGTFYVDCGYGGTLSGNNIYSSSLEGTIGIINKSGTNSSTYTCSYSDSSIRTIRFGGTATNYNTSTSTAAISFYSSSLIENVAKITAVSGNLSTMFPYISGNAADGAQPRFYQTFYNAVNLTSISNSLFAGYTTASKYMFLYTFSGCTGLTSIPSGLYSNMTTGAQNMFSYTFSGCTGLTSIPSGLFSGITTGTMYMFSHTFSGCTGLQTIPSGLFSNITTAANVMFEYTFSGCTRLQTIPANLFSGITVAAGGMFKYTFSGCTGLQTIPSGLFSNVTGANDNAASVFSNTFSGCTGLQTIPSDLFSNITTGVTYMFENTFSGCTGLTSIPSSLFANITTGANNLFKETFSGCTNLTGSVPKMLFSGLIGNTAEADEFHNNNGTATTSMFQNTFTGTGMLTSCPSGKMRYAMKYTDVWGGKVSCIDSTFNVTTSATNSFKFKIMAEGSYYIDCGPGGTLGVSLYQGSTLSTYQYTCSYSDTAPRTILFGGTMTRYVGSGSISFYTGYNEELANAAKVTAVSGDLSTIFPHVSEGTQLTFYQMFKGCTNLTSVPNTLFAGYTTGTNNMFKETFSGCTGLTSIPSDLFENITTGAQNMFYNTFGGCTGLQTIPSDLFSNITTGANYMFANTFRNCTGLTSIPSGLFSNITTGADSMFMETFAYCSNLTGYIPSTLFDGLIKNNAATNTFSNTFTNTGMLTSCPTGTAQYAANYTSAWGGKVSCIPVFTVTYACGTGGGTAPSSATAIPNASFTPAANTCTVTNGYEFSGWLVSGTNDVKPAGTAFTWNYVNDKTFTAQYSQLPPVNLTWYDNNTTISGPASCTVGSTFVPPTPEPRPGYIFTGWKVKTVTP